MITSHRAVQPVAIPTSSKPMLKEKDSTRCLYIHEQKETYENLEISIDRSNAIDSFTAIKQDELKIRNKMKIDNPEVVGRKAITVVTSEKRLFVRNFNYGPRGDADTGKVQFSTSSIPVSNKVGVMAFNNFLNFVIAEEIEFVGERFTLNLERRLLRDNSKFQMIKI
ncbi:hypothetical protein RN001_006044 [Aquatica leii]|uniref:Uncharacterized protein n=1 Tax=Aquatica leii TaxID=1421715 RepID=A0AAN7Q8I6_9COLE|nr:hypothetical protein RN001_006044 [Aquatica leii]